MFLQDFLCICRDGEAAEKYVGTISWDIFDHKFYLGFMVQLTASDAKS